MSPLTSTASNVVDDSQHGVRLIAKPEVERLRAVRGGLTALWVEVFNEGVQRIHLSSDDIELRIASHSLRATIAANVPITNARAPSMAIRYQKFMAHGQGQSIGVNAPTSRTTDRDNFSSSRTAVLTTAFKGGTLKPGEQRKGFVYFAIPSEEFSRIELIVPVQLDAKEANFDMQVLLLHARQ